MVNTITHHSESDLLQKLQKGDHSAFKQLYHLHSKQIYYKLLKMMKDQHQAEEILQELFVKVWERRDQVNPEKQFVAYLHSIAKNMAADYYRRLARFKKAEAELQVSSTEFSDDTEQTILFRETSELLQQAISKLPNQRRIAFNLCKVEGKSHKEAAEIMGISANTVHNHLVKATQTLKESISEDQAALSSVIRLLTLYLFLSS